jgi:hypothetical protein
MVWSVVRRYRMRGGLALGLVLVLLLGNPSLGLPLETAHSGDTWVLEVALPGIVDRAVLEPYDPRTPELAATLPEAASGIWAGDLAIRGWRLHLVAQEEVALGVLAVPGAAQWVALEEGRIVPFTLDDPGPGIPLPPPLRAPEAPESITLPAASPKDGVLQIALEGDAQFRAAYFAHAENVQLTIITLVSAIFEANLGVSFEVTDQIIHSTAEPDPYQGADQICTSNNRDILRQFRNHWEAVSPTTQDVREAAHLFTGRFTTGTVGCAYIKQLDTSWAYGVSSVASPVTNANLYRNVALVAHEIGHNFDGRHGLAVGVDCRTSTIMFPILCFNAPVFSHAEMVIPCRVGLACPPLHIGNAYPMWEYAMETI